MTDHHALCWLYSLKNLTERLGRWTLALREYNFTVALKSGRKHTDADSLSRCPVQPPDAMVDQMDDVFDIGALTPSTIQEEKRKDNSLVDIFNHLQASLPSSNRRIQAKLRNVCLRDGTLCRRNLSPKGNRWLIISRHLRK